MRLTEILTLGKKQIGDFLVCRGQLNLYLNMKLPRTGMQRKRRKQAEVEHCEIFKEVERGDEKNLLTRAILEKEGEVQEKTGPQKSQGE